MKYENYEGEKVFTVRRNMVAMGCVTEHDFVNLTKMNSTDNFYCTIRAVVAYHVDPKGIQKPLPPADHSPGFWWQYQDDNNAWKNYTRLQCYRINIAFLNGKEEFRLFCNYEGQSGYIRTSEHSIDFSNMIQKNVNTNREPRAIRCMGFTPILQHCDEIDMSLSIHRARSQQLTWYDFCKHADERMGWGASG